MYFSHSKEIDRHLNSLLKKLGIPVLEKDESGDHLYLKKDKIFLKVFNPETNVFLEDSVDFKNQKSERKKSTIHTQQILKKALGIKDQPKQVIDFTAGWGQDIFLFLNWGLEVVAFERNPVMFLLLWSGLREWLGAPEYIETGCDKCIHYKFLKFNFKIDLIFADSVLQVGKIPSLDLADISYIDPMFPEKKKKALSSKSMQILKILFSKEKNTENNLEIMINEALKFCKKRLVLKRPIYDKSHLEYLSNNNWVSYKGKTIRYDVVVKS